MNSGERDSSRFKHGIKSIQEARSKFAPFNHAAAGQALVSREVSSLVLDAQGALDIKAAGELLGEDMLITRRDHEVSREQFDRWNRVLETRAIRAVEEAGGARQRNADRDLLITQSAAVNQHWIAGLVPYYPTYVDTERRFDLITESMTLLLAAALVEAKSQSWPEDAGETMSHVNEVSHFVWMIRTCPYITGYETIGTESECILSNGDRNKCVLQLYCR